MGLPRRRSIRYDRKRAILHDPDGKITGSSRLQITLSTFVPTAPQSLSGELDLVEDLRSWLYVNLSQGLLLDRFSAFASESA